MSILYSLRWLTAYFRQSIDSVLSIEYKYSKIVYYSVLCSK